MKSRPAQLMELRCTLGKILSPMSCGVVAVLLLLVSETAFRHETDPAHVGAGYACLVLGIVFLLVLVFYYPVKRVFLEGRLENALSILQRLVTQEAIDNELRGLALLVAVANRRQVKIQREIGLASTEEEEQDLRKEEGVAKIHFESASKSFHDFCDWAESAGYKILKTSKGKPSFKLYLPPKQETPPSASTPTKGSWERTVGEFPGDH